MGSTVTQEKQTEFDQARAAELSKIKKKFGTVEQRRITIVGPPQAGKTQLMAALSDVGCDKEGMPYVANETAKLGFKLFSTIKSAHPHMNPIAFEMIDTPGSLLRTSRAVELYFGECEVLFIVFDISMELEESRVDKWTQQCLRWLEEHHSYTIDERVVPPFICHVFTKQDKATKQILDRNSRVVHSLVRQGIVESHQFVSARTGFAIESLTTAIFDCNVKLEAGVPRIKSSLGDQEAEADQNTDQEAIVKSKTQVQPSGWLRNRIMARTGMVFSSPRNILAPPSQIDAEAAPVEESDENNEAEDIDSN